MVEAHFGDGARWGLRLTYAQEERPLGTGGATRHALRHVRSPRVLVLNGDSWCPLEVDRLRATHAAAGARATLWLIHMDDCRRYGSVEIAPDGRVLAFREKAASAREGLVSAGVYLFERDLLEALPADRAVSLETEVFPSLIGRGLYGVVAQGPFLDIGTPESYAMAESFFAGVTRS
jgi:NDP-sugar pyrophosphorylase family protein